MRLGFLWATTALLVLAGVFLPVGHKSVEEVSCGGDWRTGRVCEHRSWDVDYRFLSMATRMHHWSDDGELEEHRTWAYPYSALAPHPEGITPLLLGGLAAIPAAIAAAAAGLWHGLRPTALSQRVHLAAWALLATSLACFMLGMAVHSGTWVAQHSAWWRPGPGLAALGALASGAQLLPRRQSYGMPALPPTA